MRKLSFFLIAAGLISLASCTQTGTEPDFGEKTQVTFNLVTGDTTRAISGEEDALPAENAIKTLEFWIFDSTGALLDPALNEATTPGYAIFTDATALELSHTLLVSAGTDKRVIIVANMAVGYEDDATYTETMARINEFKFDKTGTAKTIPTGGLEMAGVGTFDVVAGSENNQAKVGISRLTSKVNQPEFASPIVVEFDEFDQDEINRIWGVNVDDTPRFVAGTTTFTFSVSGENAPSWVVINGIEQSTIAFVGNDDYIDDDPGDVYPWDDWATVTGRGDNLVSTFDGSGAYASVYSNAFVQHAATPTTLVYLFENKPAEKESPAGTGHDPLSVNSYVIKGTLTPTGGTLADVKTRYWRVNFTRDNDYHTLRNVSYHTLVTKIVTPGYDTPKDAEGGTDIFPPEGEDAVQFTVTINKWRLSRYEVEM